MVKRVILDPEKFKGIKVDTLYNRGLLAVYRITDLESGESWVQKTALDLPDKDGNSFFGGLVLDKEAKNRYRREFDVMKKLGWSSNIAQVYDYGFFDEQGISILAMEELFPFTNYPLQGKDLLKYIVGLCNALEDMELTEIVHRDIKPSNVLHDSFGELKLLDFDWCKDESDISSHFIQNPNSKMNKKSDPIPLGTKGYRSPEQQRRERVNYRSDLFSAGLTIYEVATGIKASNVMFGENCEELVSICNDGDINRLASPFVRIYSEEFASTFLKTLNPKNCFREREPLKKISLEMLARN